MHSFKWNIYMNLLETQVLQSIDVFLNLIPTVDLAANTK